MWIVYVTEQMGGEWYKRTPLFLRGFLPCTRFALPDTRGKTSLNARDWWKGKELLFIWNNTEYGLKFFRIPTNAQSFLLPSAHSGVPYLRKEVEVLGSGCPSVPAPTAMLPPQSPVSPKPCGTFSWPTSKSPFTPFLPGKVSPAS